MEVTENIDLFEKSSTKHNGKMGNVKVPWVEKYRPRVLDDMVLDAKTKEMFAAMIASGDLRSISLFGDPGIGKSTLAKLLSTSLDCETLFIPCGTDGTVDVVRNRIEPFCDSISSGRIKCVILDEFDSASGGNAAANGMQKALRSLMEAYEDVRFIITCNYPQKIIDPIFSRCPKVHIGFTLKDVAMRLKQVWDAEGVTYDRETAKEFMKSYAYPKMPDIRGILNLAQMFSQSGTLVLTQDSVAHTENTALKDFASKIVDSISLGHGWTDVAKRIQANTVVFSGDYEILVTALADCIVDRNLNVAAIPVLADFAYRMSQVTDPALQMKGAVISLYKYLKKD